MASTSEQSVKQGTVVTYQEPEDMTGADTLLSLAQAYGNITDVALYQAAGVDLVGIKNMATKLNDQRLDITRPMDEAKTKVMNLFKPKLALLEQAERLIRAGMRSYETLEKARATAAAKLLEDNRKAAELLAQQELEDAKALERTAAELSSAGDSASAAEAQTLADAAKDRAIDSAVAATQVVAPPAHIPKIAGLARRTYYRPRITDKQAFIEHVACNPTMLDFVEIVTKAGGPLQSMVNAMKKELKLPGIEVYETDNPSEDV